MSHNILNIYSFADYEEIDTFSNLNAPSYTFLPDTFQQTLPPARTNIHKKSISKFCRFDSIRKSPK